MDNVVRSFFSEALNNTSLQSQLDPIWSRFEDSENATVAQESLSQLINLAGMHGFKFTAAELDDVIQESMATDFLEVQSGELELSDADLDLVAAGKGARLAKMFSKKLKNPSDKRRFCRVLKQIDSKIYEKISCQGIA